MGRYVIEDPSTRRFEIDESALPFWEHREGHTVVGPVPEPGEEPAQSVAVVPPPSEESDIPKPNKAASRPAQIKE